MCVEYALMTENQTKEKKSIKDQNNMLINIKLKKT